MPRKPTTPKPPKGLTPRSQKQWTESLSRRMLTVDGLRLYEMALRQLDLADACYAEADADGHTISSPHGDKQHPAIATASEQTRLAQSNFRLLDNERYTDVLPGAKDDPYFGTVG